MPDHNCDSPLRLEGPTVSVVIPTFNRVEQTRRAVQSVLAQTYPNFEVIVIDDGSDDPSALKASLAGLHDKRIRFHELEINRGANYARNIGISLSSGNYVAFLDSDDEWLPNKLASQLRTLYASGPRTVSYCSYFARTTAMGFEITDCRPWRGIRPNESIAEYLFCNRGSIVTPSLVLSRDIAVQVPFNESLKRHQDFAFLLDLEINDCQFAMVDEPLLVVNWQDLEKSGRQVRPDVATEFLRQYGRHMSAASRGGFWIKQVVHPSFFTGTRRVSPLRFPADVLIYLACSPRELFKTSLFLLRISPPWILRFASWCKAGLGRAIAKSPHGA
jgi:glycosyltransferase involved in cell wall biosynthesis